MCMERFDRSEEAQSQRALEAMIEIWGFILSEMKSHWGILIGEVTLLQSSLFYKTPAIVRRVQWGRGENRGT